MDLKFEVGTHFW